MGLEFLFGGETNYNESIQAVYHEPKEEWKFQEDLKESNYNDSIKDLKDAFLSRVNKDIRNSSPNLENTNYWKEKGVAFFGKDGTSDAYTKRGMDEQEVQYFDRQFTSKQAWRFETSDSYIDYKVGGKVFVGSKEFVIIFIVNQLNIGGIGNFLKARPNPDLIKRWGVKTLILA